MAERHDPILRINDAGLIEISCTCRRMNKAVGTKEVVRRAWDSHLGFYQVSIKDVGKLNLNILEEDGTGRYQRRDLDEFSAPVADLMREHDPMAREPAAQPGSFWLWDLPEPSPTGADAMLPEDEPRRDAMPISGRSGVILPFDGEHPRKDQLGRAAARFELAKAAVWAFTRADRQGRTESQRLTDQQKLIMTDAILMAGGSVDHDLFDNRPIRAEFARVARIPIGRLDEAHRKMLKLLVQHPKARFRLRRTIEILEAEGGYMSMPGSWQITLDSNED